jgi:hypothetical protein
MLMKWSNSSRLDSNLKIRISRGGHDCREFWNTLNSRHRQSFFTPFKFKKRGWFSKLRVCGVEGYWDVVGADGIEAVSGRGCRNKVMEHLDSTPTSSRRG